MIFSLLSYEGHTGYIPKNPYKIQIIWLQTLPLRYCDDDIEFDFTHFYVYYYQTNLE